MFSIQKVQTLYQHHYVHCSYARLAVQTVGVGGRVVGLKKKRY